MKTKIIALALALAAPMAAHAYKLDRSMACDMSVEDWFTPLVQARAIQTPAYDVKTNGLNLFKKSADDSLTFFNMTVGTVYGRGENPLFFTKVNDTYRPDTTGYGFLVKAPIAEVQSVLASVGDTQTKVRRIESDVTYLYCEFPNPQ